jgi:hypothetical protein
MEYISDLYNNISEYFNFNEHIESNQYFLKFNIPEPTEEEILKFIEDVKEEIRFEKEYKILENRFYKLEEEIREINEKKKREKEKEILEREEIKETENKNDDEDNDDNDPTGMVPVLA